jgi:hypothetical protein
MAEGIWNRIKSLLQRDGDAKPASVDDADVVNACCDQPEVHIAYRGKSDDRLYLAENRTWQEVRFFQPNGLKVFCKQCRRRVY